MGTWNSTVGTGSAKVPDPPYPPDTPSESDCGKEDAGYGSGADSTVRKSERAVTWFPPLLPATTAVDMSSHAGHFMPEQGTAMFGGDARNSYWRPKEDTCLSCKLEEAWKMGGRRRSRGRFTQGDLGCGGQQKGVYGGTSRGESPPPLKRARARSVESF